MCECYDPRKKKSPSMPPRRPKLLPPREYPFYLASRARLEKLTLPTLEGHQAQLHVNERWGTITAAAHLAMNHVVAMKQLSVHEQAGQRVAEAQVDFNAAVALEQHADRKQRTIETECQRHDGLPIPSALLDALEKATQACRSARMARCDAAVNLAAARHLKAEADTPGTMKELRARNREAETFAAEAQAAVAKEDVTHAISAIAKGKALQRRQDTKAGARKKRQPPH